VRGRLAWLIVGMVATVITIATAGTGLWVLTSYHPDTHTLHQTATYDIAQHGGRLTQLSVQLGDGDITIVSGPAGQVTVARLLKWATAEPIIDEHWDHGVLNIGQDCATGLFELGCSVSYRIAVPPGVPLNLSTGSGTITAIGARAANVQASSGSGDIQLGFAAVPTQVNVQTGSGDVSVEVPPGASYVVSAAADDGNHDITVPDDPGAPRSITAESGEGNITIAYN
jgi:hypothetical protein